MLPYIVMHVSHNSEVVSENSTKQHRTTAGNSANNIYTYSTRKNVAGADL